jgi:hypothetical protein
MFRDLRANSKVEFIAKGYVFPILRVWSLRELDIDKIETIIGLGSSQLLLLFTYRVYNPSILLATSLNRPVMYR